MSGLLLLQLEKAYLLIILLLFYYYLLVVLLNRPGLKAFELGFSEIGLAFLVKKAFTWA